jgi:hypothetical protein
LITVDLKTPLIIHLLADFTLSLLNNYLCYSDRKFARISAQYPHPPEKTDRTRLSLSSGTKLSLPFSFFSQVSIGILFAQHSILVIPKNFCKNKTLTRLSRDRSCPI